MDLRAVVEGYPGTEAAAYAWLNLAICAMHFSDHAGAHDYLQKAKAELPQRPGLSRGRGALLPGPGARQARLSAAGDRRLPRGGGGEGRHAHRQRRPAGGRPRRAAGRPVSAPARLVWERTDGDRVEFPLDADALAVGRDEDVAIRVDEPLVSRRHASIERRGDGWVVVDLGSTNFTRVNGQRVRRERELAHGDELSFGRTKLVFLAGA